MYPLYSDVGGQTREVFDLVINDDSLPDAMDRAEAALLNVMSERRRLDLERNGIEEHGQQTGEILHLRKELDPDVTLVAIRIDGQSFCKHLDANTSPSLKLRPGIEKAIAEREAQLRARGRKVRLVPYWGDLRVDCDCGGDCDPVPQSDQKNWGESAAVHDEICVRCGRDVRVFDFAYGGNQRDAREVDNFCDAVVDEDGTIVKLITPHHVHAGHKAMPKLECSRFLFALFPALDHGLGLLLADQGYAGLKHNYEQDYQTTVDLANFKQKRKHKPAAKMAQAFDTLVEEKDGDRMVASTEWLVGAVGVGVGRLKIDDYWTEIRRIKQLVADGAAVASLSTREQSWINANGAIKLGSDGYADGRGVVILSVEDSIRREKKPAEGDMHRCCALGCTKSFDSAHGLKLHLVSHVGVKKYQCQFPGCGKTFLQDINRLSHQKTHGAYNDRPIACDWPGCGKRFLQDSARKVHYRAHTGEKPFPCTYPGCSWAFAAGGDRTRHLATHSRH